MSLWQSYNPKAVRRNYRRCGTRCTNRQIKVGNGFGALFTTCRSGGVATCKQHPRLCQNQQNLHCSTGDKCKCSSGNVQLSVPLSVCLHRGNWIEFSQGLSLGFKSGWRMFPRRLVRFSSAWFVTAGKDKREKLQVFVDTCQMIEWIGCGGSLPQLWLVPSSIEKKFNEGLSRLQVGTANILKGGCQDSIGDIKIIFNNIDNIGVMRMTLIAMHFPNKSHITGLKSTFPFHSDHQFDIWYMANWNPIADPFGLNHICIIVSLLLLTLRRQSRCQICAIKPYPPGTILDTCVESGWVWVSIFLSLYIASLSETTTPKMNGCSRFRTFCWLKFSPRMQK